MPSPFDQYFLPTSEFIPEYQGMPLAQIESSAQRLEQTYMQNLAGANQLDILNAERRAIAGDVESNKRVAEKYSGVIDEMAKAGDYEHMTGRVAALAREYARDPEVKAIQESRKNFEEEQSLAQEMTARGKTPLFMGDPSSHKSYDPETGESSVYRPRVEQMLDYDTRREGIWKTLNADRYITGLTAQEKAVMPDVINQYLNYGMSEGIFDSKIAQNLENVMNSYRSTPEYRQEIKKLQSEGLSDEQAESQIRRNVLDRGELRQYVRRNIQSLRPQDTDGGGMGLGPGYEEMAADHLQTEVGYSTDDFDVRERKEKKYGTTSSHTEILMTGRPQAKNYTGQKADITPEERTAYTKGYTAGAEIFAPQGTDTSKLSADQQREYAEKYEDLVKDRMLNYKINTTDFTREYAERNLKPSDVTQSDLLGRVEDELNRHLESRSFFDVTSGETFTALGEDGALSEQFVDYIGDPDNIIVSGVMDPKHYYTKHANNPEFSDAYVVTVRNPEDEKSRQVLVTRSDSSRDNVLGVRANQINGIYSTFSVKPNQEHESSVLGVPIKGKKLVGVDNQGNIFDRGLSISIQGSKPLNFRNEEELVDFIMRKTYGGQQ